MEGRTYNAYGELFSSICELYELTITLTITPRITLATMSCKINANKFQMFAGRQIDEH